MATPLDSRQLNAFTTLAETGSYTKTAKQLYLTQSAISHSIKALERDLGASLVRRVGKKIQLTEAGEKLYTSGSRILGEMDRVRTSLKDINQWGGGRLRIGAGATSCEYILPSVLREFKECFPRCQVILDAGDTPAALEKLRNSEIDIALTLEPGDRKEFEFIPLFKDELRFLVSAIHPWAIAGKVNLKEIAHERLIVYHKSSYTYKLVARHFRELSVDLAGAFELSSIQAMKEMLKISMGVGVLAPWVATREIEEGSLVSLPIGKKKIKRQWGLSHLPGRKLSLTEESFIGLCEAACA